jgi:hypothetical protein
VPALVGGSFFLPHPVPGFQPLTRLASTAPLTSADGTGRVSSRPTGSFQRALCHPSDALPNQFCLHVKPLRNDYREENVARFIRKWTAIDSGSETPLYARLAEHHCASLQLEKDKANRVKDERRVGKLLPMGSRGLSRRR